MLVFRITNIRREIAEVKNDLSYTSTFSVCLHGVYREVFISKERDYVHIFTYNSIQYN